jgi:hypothetical protein
MTFPSDPAMPRVRGFTAAAVASASKQVNSFCPGAAS